MIGRMKPVAVARAVVRRADGTTEVHYSRETINFCRDPLRWLKQRRHLAFMRKEDEQWR
jgi:hypothetical protein